MLSLWTKVLKFTSNTLLTLIQQWKAVRLHLPKRKTTLKNSENRHIRGGGGPKKGLNIFRFIWLTNLNIY